MYAQAEAGRQIFYDIYTEEEKASDPDKKDTSLFFFKGEPGAKFAVCSVGGGFAYVRAMHDSFPHALELSKKGYNAFALIYRPGAQTACEDLAQAIAFIHEYADELEVDTASYSLWGGSAGARMAACLGSYGTVAFGASDCPKPGVVIMQYIGYSDFYPDRLVDLCNSLRLNLLSTRWRLMSSSSRKRLTNIWKNTACSMKVGGHLLKAGRTSLLTPCSPKLVQNMEKLRPKPLCVS